MAQEPVAGLGSYAPREQIYGVVDAVHDLAITSLASEHAARLAEVIVQSFFEQFGGYTPTELLDEFDLSREDLVADLVRIAPGAIDALREAGDLSRSCGPSSSRSTARPRSPPYWPDREPQGRSASLVWCRSDDAAGSLTHVTAMPIIRPCRPVGVASHSSRDWTFSRRAIRGSASPALEPR